jgi:serine phosphatase RsbU (regulator of sigma subunit)
MPAFLYVTHSDKTSERFALDRPRITIGRSARNDLCISDPFASRVHVEVRREGETYILQDLNSANGTLFNGSRLRDAARLANGDLAQIGETSIVFEDSRPALPQIDFGDAPAPEATITFDSAITRTTSGLLDAIEGTRTQIGVRVAVPPTPDKHQELLKFISKVSVTLLSPASLDELLTQITTLVFEAVPADRCLIMLRDDADKAMKVHVARLRNGANAGGDMRVSHKVMEEVIGQGKSVLTADAMHDPQLASQTMALQGIRSVMAVPLGVGANVFGLIYADSPFGEGRFTADHLEVLTMLASVAAIRVENARLMEERLERERMERELQLACEIQQRFLPAAPPVVEGYDLQGISFPCYEIGGDYYDFIFTPEDRLLVALGDVSGKGTAAALLMSSLHASVHAQTTARRTISETIHAVNVYLAENTPSNRFVTLFYASLNPADGQFNYINAGHNSPLIIRADGSAQTLDSGGLPLGMMPMATYDEEQLELAPGDVFVAYSDGVSEALNPQEEEFCLSRLQETVVANRHLNAAQLRDKIEAALSQWADGTPANDDITLVIVKRKG